MAVSLGNISLIVGAAIAAATVYQTATTAPAPQRMELLSLEYNAEKNGMGQALRVEGSHPVAARWTAQIMRGEREVCAGTGNWNYTLRDGSELIWLPLDEWTGDDCPDKLMPGDVARAVWEYSTESGFYASTWGELKIE